MMPGDLCLPSFKNEVILWLKPGPGPMGQKALGKVRSDAVALVIAVLSRPDEFTDVMVLVDGTYGWVTDQDLERA